MASSTTADSPVDLTRSAAFPLHVEGGARQLWGADGKPFLISGDTAWSMITELDKSELETYLANRKRLGFNTVLVELIEHRFSSHAPKNAFGDAPFKRAGDFSQPNEAYFAYADWVLQRLSDEGFLVLLTPDYAGWEGNSDGWWEEMKANGPDVLRAYGRFVGSRYAKFDNIIWVNGGDYNPPDKTLIEAVRQGISEADPDALQTAHLTPDEPPREVLSGTTWLDLDNVYTYEPVYDSALAAYRGSSMPFFLMESSYENEHNSSTRSLRTQAYHALLAGATGHVFGNNPIWHFDGPGIFDAPTGWREALDGAGSQSMAGIARLMGSLEWWQLRPSIDQPLLVDGLQAGGTRAAAALSADGSWGMVYVPTERTISLNLGQLAGTGASITWYDASTGIATFQAQLGKGMVSVKTPGKNAGGDSDWVAIVRQR